LFLALLERAQANICRRFAAQTVHAGFEKWGRVSSRTEPDCTQRVYGAEHSAKQPAASNHDGPASDLLPLVIFFAVALVIGLALLVAPFLVAPNKPDPEKLSAYECGFPAFDDARMKFDVRFYLVSILFIIFDLEVAFLFPWTVAFKEAGEFGFWAMMIFLGILTVGFIYEWKKGALEWD
jgi:NADH-quinone oxidoreductase subunit A